MADARVPLIRFKFDGIPIDLPYAKLNAISVPENVDVFNSLFLININEICWRSLSGVRANKSILQHVPNLQVYQSLLRCVKFWAKRRGIYGHAQGFFGGIHLAVLAAFVCRRQPHAHLITLVLIFFQTFASWPWPMPVVLEDGVMPLPPNNISILMPIQLPSSPNEYCYSNMIRSTVYRIRQEFIDAHALTKEILRPEFDWKILFEPFPYVKMYARFLKIRLSCPREDELGGWVGKVKSRMRCLLIKLEELQGFCDPNPTEYVDINIKEPNKVFYWGLCPGRSCNMNIDSIRKDFMMNIFTGCEGPIGRLELKVVKASEVPIQKTNMGSRGSRRNIVYMPQNFVGCLAGNGNVGCVS
ncbi:Polynucleotide adenylyltransferase [Handroanthus impetiginosus]|uniref:polynucleotide adenylyltransferase n=1 Tax=Handroanthus impetiginosus TaxID=429701 RepID=A0A2G9GZA1_9LAMI|nr:Polynucleotide adenylyltransferase [Handroanthus impetiginosus]